MIMEFKYRPRKPAEFPRWQFQTLDLEYDAPTRSVWMYYKADATPFYSYQTLLDMADVRESLRALFSAPERDAFPIRYFAMASRKPGVFQLGGDLHMFANAIRENDQAMLRSYAHACIDVVYGLSIAFDLPIVSLSVIAGQALGGGLEAALADDFLLAEETAKIGVPEIAFNTFPGMGAVSLLSRRLGSAEAEAMIASGKVYTGAEMHRKGVVDVLAADGQAEQAAKAWMLEGGPERFARRLAMASARRRFFPVSYEELVKITDLWVDCSCDVTPHDIRHMEKLAAAQKKMLQKFT